MFVFAMEKRGRFRFALLFLVVAVFSFVLFSFYFRGGITGLAVFQGTCSNSINSGGYWELNSSLGLCGNSTGIYLNASNVQLDCKGYQINGNYSENAYGVFVQANLNNVSMSNCNVTGFKNAVFIGTGSVLSISGSYASSSEQCVLGNWTDVSGNTGCLDIVSPVFSVNDSTIYNNQSFAYQVQTSDISGIASYNLTDSALFSVNSSGYMYNSSALAVTNYTLNLSVYDSVGNFGVDTFVVSVLESVVQTQTSNSTNTTQTTTTQTTAKTTTKTESKSSSTTTASTVNYAEQCVSGVGWKCSEWGECLLNGTRVRECTKLIPGCVIRDKSVENCTYVDPATLVKEECVENWQCTWSECVNGEKVPTECVDLNSCGTEVGKPTAQQCETVSNVAARPGITGAASLFVEGTKKVANFFAGGVLRVVISLFVLVVVIGGAVCYFLMKNGKFPALENFLRRNFSRGGKKEFYKGSSPPSRKELEDFFSKRK